MVGYVERNTLPHYHNPQRRGRLPANRVISIRLKWQIVNVISRRTNISRFIFLVPVATAQELHIRQAYIHHEPLLAALSS